MSEVKRFRADWRHVVETEFDDAQYVGVADFDRVTAERDALQKLLNAADQQVDDAATENNDRELSRRDWFDEAQRLERENEGLRSEVKRLDLMVAQADYNYDMDRAQFKQKLSERDALLRAAQQFVENWDDDSQEWMDLSSSISNALSTSAELIPRCPGCGYTYQDCREQMDHYLCGLPEPSAPKDWCATMARPKSKCGCPDCGSSIVQICAKAERDERAEFDEWFRNEKGLRPEADTTHVDAAFIPYRAWMARAALERKP